MYRVSLFQARNHRRGTGGFHAVDACGRTLLFEGSSDSGDQSTTADRDDHDICVWERFEDFETSTRVASHDIRVIERMDEGEAMLALDFVGFLERVKDGPV